MEYKSPKMGELQDWAVRQWEQSKNRTVGIYSGALGFGYNTELLKSKGVAEPKCWADLLNPKLKDEVQVADPNSSGTAYTLLATIVQIMGEDKGFEYLKALHKNVNQYTKSGAAPPGRWRSARPPSASPSCTTSSRWSSTRRPIKVVAPCEGTGYEIGSMSIIKGAKNMDNAKKFYDWALTAGGAEARRGGEVLPGAVQQDHAGSAAGAEARRHQADHLRFRQVRLVGRAQAPPVQVGQRGEEPAEIVGPPPSGEAGTFAEAFQHGSDGAGFAIGPEVGTECHGLLAGSSLGWVGYALLPWYGFERSRFLVRRLLHRRIGTRPRAARSLVASAHLVPLLLALRPAAGHLDRNRQQLAHRLGTARASPSWSFKASPSASTAGRSILADRSSASRGRARRHGLWRGADRARLPDPALPRLAARGWCRGDAFVTSSIGVVVALIVVFVFFPVSTILASAFQDNNGDFAPAEFVAKFIDRSIWGLDCLTSGLRCGVAWNTLFLALLVGVGTTALGLAFALIATRTAFRYKGSARADACCRSSRRPS